MSRTLYSWARTDSTNAEAPPTRAIIHIQKTAPGPPMVIAVATPAMLPVPIRAAAEMVNAPKGLTPDCGLSLKTRNISGIRRICTPLERSVNQTPTTATSGIST
ncbi:hypothetical protein SUDANB37_00690 [Streptomyces sp. enrichment culture]